MSHSHKSKPQNTVSDKIATIRRNVEDIFDTDRWNENQMKCYLIIKQSIEKNKDKYCQYGYRNDKNNIRTNISGQKWYIIMSAAYKLVINQLIEQISVSSNFCHNSTDTKILDLVVTFGPSWLVVKYFQSIDDLISLQIYITDGKKKCFMAYYRKARLLVMSDHIKDAIKVPELDDLCQMMNINDNLLPPRYIFLLLMEVTLYFDQTETIASLKIADLESENPIHQLLESSESSHNGEISKH